MKVTFKLICFFLMSGFYNSHGLFSGKVKCSNNGTLFFQEKPFNWSKDTIYNPDKFVFYRTNIDVIYQESDTVFFKKTIELQKLNNHNIYVVTSSMNIKKLILHNCKEHFDTLMILGYTNNLFAAVRDTTIVYPNNRREGALIFEGKKYFNNNILKIDNIGFR